MAQLSILLAQQQTPVVDSMYWIMLISRILHIAGAMILVGGLFYIRFVLAPVDNAAGPASVDQLYGGRRATWAKWVGAATALLLVTGFWNYIQFSRTFDLAKKYHMIMGFKILAGLAVFLLAALLAGRTAAAESIRRKWRLWLGVCLVLGFATAILGSVLRTYPHIPKVDAPAGPKLIAPTASLEK